MGTRVLITLRQCILWAPCYEHPLNACVLQALEFNNLLASIDIKTLIRHFVSLESRSVQTLRSVQITCQMTCSLFLLPEDGHTYRPTFYTLWPKVGGHLTITPIWSSWTSNSKTVTINMELPLFVAVTAFTLLERFSHKILEGACGNFYPFWRSGTDVRWENLAHTSSPRLGTNKKTWLTIVLPSHPKGFQ